MPQPMTAARALEVWRALSCAINHRAPGALTRLYRAAIMVRWCALEEKLVLKELVTCNLERTLILEDAAELIRAERPTRDHY